MYPTQMSNHGSNAFFEAVRVALGSFLTLLGIILASTTLIAVMSLIHGMDVYIAALLSKLTRNRIWGSHHDSGLELFLLGRQLRFPLLSNIHICK